MLSELQFPHRHNNDGTYDSICDTCFVTVARVKTEADLIQFESRHVCDPVNLYWASQSFSASSLIAHGAPDMIVDAD
jgi:hypothetical protein